MVGKEESEDGVIVKWRKGLLYRVGKEREMQTREQLVLPTKCRRVVMELAHSIPLAGHLGSIRPRTVRSKDSTGQQYEETLRNFVGAVRVARSRPRQSPNVHHSSLHLLWTNLSKGSQRTLWVLSPESIRKPVRTGNM